MQREHSPSREAVYHVLTPSTFDQAQIREYVGGSYYNYGILDAAGLHPFDGKTTPNMGYSRLQLDQGTEVHGRTQQPTVYEVGPLARMVVTYLSGTQVTANDTVTGWHKLGTGTRRCIAWLLQRHCPC